MTPENFHTDELEQLGREIGELPGEIRELVEVKPEEIAELKEIAQGVEPLERDAVRFGAGCYGCSSNCYGGCSGSCSSSCSGSCYGTASGK